MNAFNLVFLIKTCIKVVVRSAKNLEAMHSVSCRFLLLSTTVLNDTTILINVFN